MVAAITATAVAAVFWGGSHLTIWIEAILIALFASFWGLQTIELWGPGLRGQPGRRRVCDGHPLTPIDEE